MKQRGYNILVVIQVALIVLILIVSRTTYLRIPALHGSPFKILVSIIFLTLSVLFFIKPFRPEQRIYAYAGVIMNLVVLLYLWYAWFTDVSLG